MHGKSETGSDDLEALLVRERRGNGEADVGTCFFFFLEFERW